MASNRLFKVKIDFKSYFGAILDPFLVPCSSFLVFQGLFWLIFGDLGSIVGGFWEDVGWIFVTMF